MSERLHKILLILLIVASVAALAYLLRSVVHLPAPKLPEPRSIPISPALDIATETVKAGANPVHKGGVKNVADLRRLIQENPDIARHFKNANFDVNCATEEVLAVSTWTRVSFRVGNGFAYTQHPVLILAGERIFADQCHSTFIRAQCANIALVGERMPQLSADSTQGGLLIPPGGDLPFTLPPTDVVPPQSPAPAPPGPQPVPSGPPAGAPFYPVPVCCFVGLAPSPAPSTVTPEPSTWLLLIGGSAVLFVFRILRGPR